jgi:hypothetical protein
MLMADATDRQRRDTQHEEDFGPGLAVDEVVQ